MTAALRSAAFLSLLFLFAPPARAEDAIVKILSPVEGAKLEAKQVYSLDYEVQAGPKANHVHLFVDGDETAMGHKLKGGLKLGPLKAGERNVCVQAANKNHTPIGEKTCVKVTVQ